MAENKKKYKVVVSTTVDMEYVVEAWSPGHAKELVEAETFCLELPNAKVPPDPLGEYPFLVQVELTGKRIFRPILSQLGKPLPGHKVEKSQE
jgi:hypothetical protein